MLYFPTLSICSPCAQRGRQAGQKASPPFLRAVTSRARCVLWAFRPASRQLIPFDSENLWALKVWCVWQVEIQNEITPKITKKWALRCWPAMPLCVPFDLGKRQPLGGKTTISYICKMLKHFFSLFLKSAILIKYQILKSISRQLSSLHPADCSSIHRASCWFFFPPAFLVFICRAAFCFLCKPFGIRLHQHCSQRVCMSFKNKNKKISTYWKVNSTALATGWCVWTRTRDIKQVRPHYVFSVAARDEVEMPASNKINHKW